MYLYFHTLMACFVMQKHEDKSFILPAISFLHYLPKTMCSKIIRENILLDIVSVFVLSINIWQYL